METQKKDLSKKSWKDIMREGSEEESCRVVASRVPKQETYAQPQDMTTQMSYIEEAEVRDRQEEIPLATQNFQNLDLMKISHNLDLNLSLVPSCQWEGGFDLNLEPDDKKLPHKEDPNRGTSRKRTTTSIQFVFLN